MLRKRHPNSQVGVPCCIWRWTSRSKSRLRYSAQRSLSLCSNAHAFKSWLHLRAQSSRGRNEREPLAIWQSQTRGLGATDSYIGDAIWVSVGKGVFLVPLPKSFTKWYWIHVQLASRGPDCDWWCISSRRNSSLSQRYRERMARLQAGHAHISRAFSSRVAWPATIYEDICLGVLPLLWMGTSLNFDDSNGG